jgi:FAD/FMN-containing dehydrogenase
MTTGLEWVCGYDALTCMRPSARRQPKTGEQLCNRLTLDGPRRTLRAGGWSLDGQATTGETLLELTKLEPVVQVQGHAYRPDEVEIETAPEGDSFATVGSRVTWRTLCEAALAQGLLPASTVTGPDITVIGALSSDCVSRFSHVWGPTFTHVRSIDVLLPTGELRRDVRADADDPATRALFRAAIAGFGLVGVILSATLRLRRVLSWELASEQHVAQSLRAETIAFKFDAGSLTSDPTVWWTTVLTRLRERGERARKWRENVPHQGWRALPGGSANPNPIYDAQSTAGYFTAETMHAVQYESRFVEDGQRGLPEFELYAGLTTARFVGEWALSQPGWHECVQRVFTHCLPEKATWRNRVDPFLFFMEANAELRMRVRGHRPASEWREILQSPHPWRAAGFNAPRTVIEDDAEDSPGAPDGLVKSALEGFDKRFGVGAQAADGPLGAPTFAVDAQAPRPTLYALQQTHLLPNEASAAAFLEGAHREMAKRKVTDRATLFDLLYLRGHEEAPYLSIAGAHGGFAVTIGWQEILLNPSEMREEQKLARILAALAITHRGKVSLTKNVYAVPGTVQTSLDSEALAAFREVKGAVDPKGRLGNAFYDAHLGS